MASAVGGMSKQSLVTGLGSAVCAFGAVSTLFPRAFAKAYGVPDTPHGRQMQRLLGARTVALGVWGLTAKSEEESQRALAVVAGMNLLDAVTALRAAKEMGSAATMRGVASSAAYAAAALGLRALSD
jgi:Domain of unknown function (DUF4267)